jgi:aspartyl/asparaginyl beta-hydroxylase (cupin superfamily)
MCIKNAVFFHSDESEFLSDDPPFYNPMEFDTVKSILSQYDVIKNELQDYVSGRVNIAVSNPNAPYKNMESSWQHLYFLNYMLPYKSGIESFPRTSAILLSNTDVTLCGIATLKAGGKLMPHCGETNTIIRCHLGLKIPGQLPEVGIRVKDEQRSWQEGGVIAFNDAFNHEAWNYTNRDRYVLIFDIIKPELRAYKNLICAYCLGIASARIFLGKVGLYNMSPIWLRKFLAVPLAIAGYLLIIASHFLQNFRQKIN